MLEDDEFSDEVSCVLRYLDTRENLQVISD